MNILQTSLLNSVLITSFALALGVVGGIVVAWYLYKKLKIEKVASLTTFKTRRQADTIRARLTDETECEVCHTTGVGVKNTYTEQRIIGGFTVGEPKTITEYYCLYHSHEPEVIANIARAKLNNENYDADASRYVRNITTEILHTTQRLCEHAGEMDEYASVNDSPICDAELDDEVVELDARTRLQFLCLIPPLINEPTVFTHPGDRTNLRRLWALVYTATIEEENVSTSGTMSSTSEPVMA